MNRFQSLITTIFNNKNFLEVYINIRTIIESTGLLDILREKGKVRFVREASTDTMALEAARAAGYQEALDDIMLFVERYGQSPVTSDTKVPMEWGGLDTALSKGDLTKEEIDAIRTGKPIKYQ